MAEHPTMYQIDDAVLAGGALIDALEDAYRSAGCRFDDPSVIAVEREATRAALDRLGLPDPLVVHKTTQRIRENLRARASANSPRRAREVQRRLEVAVQDVVQHTASTFDPDGCGCSWRCDHDDPVTLPDDLTTEEITSAVDMALRSLLGDALTPVTGVAGNDDEWLLRPFPGEEPKIRIVSGNRIDRRTSGRNVTAVRKSLDSIAGSARSQRGRGLVPSSVGDLEVASRGVTARVLANVSGDAYHVRCSWLVGVSIPSNLSKITPECSCMDYRDWCKHIAATLYVLACELDRDPSAITKAIEGNAPWKQRQTPAA